MFYWLEYADVPDHRRRGPLGPSAVRHENGDLVRLSEREVRTVGPDFPERWRYFWEEKLGRSIELQEFTEGE